MVLLRKTTNMLYVSFERIKLTSVMVIKNLKAKMHTKLTHQKKSSETTRLSIPKELKNYLS